MELLFKAETEYTYDEYKKFNRVIQNKIRRIPLVYFVVVVLYALFGWLFNSVMLVVMGLLFPFIIKIILTWQVKKAYQSNALNKGMSYSFEFYQDYLEQKTTAGNLIVSYDKIYRILETDTNFYIMIAKNQGIIISKDNCSPGLIDFIKGLMK